MRLILGVFATLFAFAALSILSLVVDATSKSLALATAEISYIYTLQPGVSYTLTVDKYGFQTLTVSGSPGGSYARLALSMNFAILFTDNIYLSLSSLTSTQMRAPVFGSLYTGSPVVATS